MYLCFCFTDTRVFCIYGTINKEKFNEQLGDLIALVQVDTKTGLITGIFYAIMCIWY